MNALANDLEAGFEILWYRVESVLGRGGFGITYLAEDTNLNQQVAVKEYLPHDFASRSGDSTVQPATAEQSDMYSWGLERFMSEAQTLAKFKHHNIVRVLSVFKQNNTGYMVMEYEVGRPLNVIYKEQKILPQSELESIYYPIIDGLKDVHKEGFIHRDIKPANIYIRQDGSPVLLDFGAARQAVGTKTRTLTSMLSIGYAPFEQYNDGSGKQGPWTDVYALGACLYQGITGNKPMESTLRGMALIHDEPDPYEPLSHLKPEGYSHAFLRAIDQGLMLQINDRPQTLEEFLSLLKGETTLPDIPPRKQQEAPGINERTIIRQVKGAFHGNDVSFTDDVATEKITLTENMAADEIPVGIASDRVDVELSSDTPSATPAKTHKIKLAGAAALLVLLIIFVAIIFSGEKSPPQSPVQTSVQTPVKSPDKSPIPDPEEIKQQQIAELLKKADVLFNAGTYFDPSGDDALTRYKEVLSLESDNTTAREGLNKIAGRVLANARQSIKDKDFVTASSSLKMVNSIAPDYAGLKPLQHDLSELLKSEKKFKQLDILLGNAQRALDRGHLYTPEQKSAYAYFSEVLAFDTENITAMLGLSEVSDQMIEDARKALRDKDLTQAEKLLALAESITPNKPAINNIKQQISKTSELKQLITQADAAYKKRRYTTPESDNAVAYYNRVLDISPGNTLAAARMDKMAEFYAGKTRGHIRSGKLSAAKSSLNTLTSHFPDYARSKKLKTELNQKQNQITAAAKAKEKAKARERDRLKAIRHLIPAGISQKQDDDLVVQDIVGQFLQYFKKQDIKSLKKVVQLNPQQESLYTSLFKLYRSMSIKLVPKTFTVNKRKGQASAKFTLSDLIDKNGREVQTSANWTKLNLTISKKSGVWLKAELKNP